MTFPSTVRKHWVGAILMGLAVRLFFVWRFPYAAGDTKIYEELARNWLDHGVYGLFLDGQLTPAHIRMPGYPAFLAAVYAVLGRTPQAVMLVQALLDVVTCVLIAALAARLSPGPTRARAAAAAIWLAALCPFTANYTATLLTEVLTTFLTALALLFILDAYMSVEPFSFRVGNRLISLRNWFLGGFIVGLGTLVRPEAPLLLMAVGLVLCVRWRRRVDGPKLVRSALWMAVGLMLPLVPWAARNWYTLGRVQFLAPRYAELPGEYAPRGFYAWTKTWLVRFRDVYTVWKLEEQPISIESFPASAFDSDQERQRVAALLAQYNQELHVSPALDSEFARLARERTARHPLRTYIWIPLERIATMWFTPRIELLPYSGSLWPLGERWEEDHTDFLVTVVLGLLNFVYVGLALVGAWRWRRRPALAPLVSFIAVRTAFLTQVETPEPRYVLVCFPAILALAALAWRVTSADNQR